MIAQQETTPTQVFKEFILVPHTHWDREWYLTFQQFRAKLVDLFDQLLELLNADPQYPAFTLDGQTIMLEDYLAVRPERRGELAQRIAQGRLLVGPWYVMPDEFLVSPEAIVRNLLLGRRLAQEFGGGMDVGYVPDPFGHIAQLPQILQGFGIDCALFMRGMGDEGEALGDVFLWEAPDGSAVLAHHQLTSYGNAANLPLDPDLAARLVRNVATRMARLAVTPVLLLNNGSDHLRPQPALRRIVQELEQRLDRHVEFGSHRAYIERVKAHRPALKRFRGELRGGRYAMLLPSVLSTRMYLKQANHQVQTALERWAEPVAALAWALGHRYPAGLLQEAWRLVLQNHPHDS
ncbi:MAG: hypothetical protein HY335_06785, partial [Deinococcus sp.]|nr:hypothetical protein [Deinococcus sp.]